MRFSAAYRLTRMRGFFWGSGFFAYGSRWLGLTRALTFKRQRRLMVYRLGDGFWGRLWLRRTPFARERIRAASLSLLNLWPAHRRPAYPWAWRILYYLRIRAYRSSRYRLGLPCRGQRTHTNASTAGRNRDFSIRFVRFKGWIRRIGEARKRSAFVLKKRKPKVHGKKGGKVKQVRGKSVVRSRDKKKDVWR